jgi:outer membrane protein OmpA-like peptidoglycan-associated protein
MSLRRNTLTSRSLIALLTLFLVITLVPLSSAAQDDTTHPKAELFGGYSWYNPGGRLVNPGSNLPGIPKGWGAAATFNVNRWLGITADFGGHYKNVTNVHTYLFGAQLKARKERFIPFIDLLAGFANISPASPLASKNSPSFAGGGGIDYKLNNHFEWRVIQADYIYTTYRDKALQLTTNRWDGARVQGGGVFTFGGGEKQLPVSAACSAPSPAEVMAGEPVKVTLTPTNFNPKRQLTYAFESTGGKVSTSEATATIDTTGLAPGAYNVTGKVNDNGKGKKMMAANCTASFTVKEPPKHPPVISCSANPTTVKSGEPATVSANASSPDARPLTYSWNTSGGHVTGTGASVQLDTAGAPAGPITVNGTVSDDRGLTASCSSTVNVEVPPPPPTASKLNEINFPDTKRPGRVDNAAKAILDDVALKLQRDADAKAVVIGYAMADELKKKANKDLAAERAYNTKQYLTQEKGIDPSRIEVRTGTGEGQKAEIWIVPAGATFTGEGTTVVDESMFAKKPAKKPAHKPAAKKPAAP